MFPAGRPPVPRVQSPLWPCRRSLCRPARRPSALAPRSRVTGPAGRVRGLRPRPGPRAAFQSCAPAPSALRAPWRLPRSPVLMERVRVLTGPVSPRPVSPGRRPSGPPVPCSSHETECGGENLLRGAESRHTRLFASRAAGRWPETCLSRGWRCRPGPESGNVADCRACVRGKGGSPALLLTPPHGAPRPRLPDSRESGVRPPRGGRACARGHAHSRRRSPRLSFLPR